MHFVYFGASGTAAVVVLPGACEDAAATASQCLNAFVLITLSSTRATPLPGTPPHAASSDASTKKAPSAGRMRFGLATRGADASEID